MQQRFFVITFLFTLIFSSPASAYVGPGLGLGGLAVVFGLVLSLVLSILGIFWYPAKRILGLGRKRQKIPKDSDQEDVDA